METRKPRILIADDEPNIRQGLAEALEDQGYEWLEVEPAQTAGV